MFRVPTLHPKRRGHRRAPRIENPVACPACKSPYWNRKAVR